MKITAYKKPSGEAFHIEGEKAYQIINKFDANAPDGFRRERTTKVLDSDASEQSIPLSVYDSQKRCWDTALDNTSRRLNELFPNKEDLQRHLQDVTKHIYNPLLQIYTKEMLDSRNNEFWDGYRYKLNFENVLNTKDPEQRAYLYFAVIHGHLAPVDFESEPLFKRCAQFSVENKESVITVSQKRDLERNKAIARFTVLLEEDKEFLEIMLDYMGIPGLAGADESFANAIFTNWLSKDDNQNPKQFLEIYKNFYKSEAGKKELKIYKTLKDMEKVKSIKVTVDGLLFDEEIIGKNFKEASKNVATSAILFNKIYKEKETIE